MLVHLYQARLLSCYTYTNTQTAKIRGQHQNSQPRSLSLSLRPEVPASNPCSACKGTSPAEAQPSLPETTASYLAEVLVELAPDSMR